MNTISMDDDPHTGPPNLDWLGRGFNIFGSLSSNSVLNRIVNPGPNTKPVTVFGHAYWIPECVALVEDSRMETVSKTYASTTKCQEELTAEVQSEGHAKIRGIGLQGEMSARFDLKLEREDSRKVSTTTSHYHFYTLDFDRQLQYDMLVPEALTLPTKYDDSTRDAFFEFFNTHGVFYISKIRCGGTLQMNSSTTDSSRMTSAEVNAKEKVAADVFGVAGGESTYLGKWGQVDSSWLKNSSLSWRATGGHVGYLVVVPGDIDPKDKPFIEKDALAKWGDSLKTDPAVTTFEITTLADLIAASGKNDPQASALRAAAIDYIGGSIVITSGARSGAASWYGHKVENNNDTVVIIDRTDVSKYNSYTQLQITAAVVDAALSPKNFCVYFSGSNFMVEAMGNLLGRLCGRAGANLDGYAQIADSGAHSPFGTLQYAAMTWVDDGGTRKGIDQAGFDGETISLPVPLWQRDGKWYGPGGPR